jgi:hypothetical protein
MLLVLLLLLLGLCCSCMLVFVHFEEVSQAQRRAVMTAS